MPYLFGQLLKPLESQWADRFGLGHVLNFSWLSNSFLALLSDEFFNLTNEEW